MERRTFFRSLTASLAALPFLPHLSAGLSQQFQQLQDDLKDSTDDELLWKRIRQEFLLKPDFVHLNCGSIGTVPRLVLDAQYRYACELESSPVFNTFWGLADGMEVVREKAAEFIGATKDEILLTRNTTEGMNLVATGLDLKRGDEILTTNHEHGGGMVGWQHLAQRHGVKIVQIQMPAPVRNVGQILDLISDHITPRTRVCSFSHVETITGLLMPMAEIAKITRPKGIFLVCDGAQVPGMLEVDVKALDVDTYASSSHKWMLAAKGCGLLYLRKEVQKRIQTPFTFSGYTAYSQSTGTRNVPQILAHGVTMDFHNAIGRDRIEARCRLLCQRMRQRLSDLPALRLLTPHQKELSSGMVAVAVDPDKGNNREIAAQLLDEHQIAVKILPGTYAVEGGLPAQNYNALRFSTHIYNNESEVDRTVDLLASILKT